MRMGPELWEPALDKNNAPPDQKEIATLAKAVKVIAPILRRYSDNLYYVSRGSERSTGMSMARVLSAHYWFVRRLLQSATKDLEGAIKEIEEPGSTHSWGKRLGWHGWTWALSLSLVNWASFFSGAGITLFLVLLVIHWT
jgi:hypothetical protein